MLIANCQLLSAGLLLRHAVHRSKSPDQISRVNSDNFAIRKYIGQRVESDAIVGVVEYWDQHHAVSNIEIGVAGGQTASFEDHRSGHRKFDDRERLSILIGGGAEAADIFAQRFIVGIVGIGLNRSYDRVGSDKTSDVVHVAVSVIAGDARSQPDHISDSEILGEDIFVVTTFQSSDCVAGLC